MEKGICPTPDFKIARGSPRSKTGNQRRLAAIDRIANDFAKAHEAIDRLVKDEVPNWLNPIEKKAYVLGVITDDDIVDHERCKGRGWLPTVSPYADGDACSCPKSNGKVIALDAKRCIKAVYPEYVVIEDQMARMLEALNAREALDSFKEDIKKQRTGEEP